MGAESGCNRAMYGSLLTVLLVSMLAGLAACGTPRSAVTPNSSATSTSSASSPSAQPASAPGATAPRTNLASEQVRLAELFRGTPVVFSMQQDGSLRATVPRRFSFDAGTAKVKAPLAAVLDRLAKSQSQTRSVLRVSAPPDPPARPGTLAQERANNVRDHLIAQGVVAARVQIGSGVPADMVEIVVSESAR